MARFSDRIGITKPPTLTRDQMSPELQTALWNSLYIHWFESGTMDVERRWYRAARSFYSFNHIPLDQLTESKRIEHQRMRVWWFDGRRPWWELYNSVQLLVPQIAQYHYGPRNPVYHEFNIQLECEGARFRFVGDELTEITDENEIAAVNETLSAPGRFGGARQHIAAALRFLGQRPEPDYRNSISESISAVESTLKVLTGLDHAPLGDALKVFSKANPIHGALFSGLGSLYGYTSNEHGIRHALLDDTANVGFAEAKFMVVACAAFVNFLIVKGAA